MKNYTRFLRLGISILILLCCKSVYIEGTENKGITLKSFMEELIPELKIETDLLSKDSCIKAGIREGLLLKDEFNNNEALSYSDCALILYRGAHIYNKEAKDETLIKSIKDNQRIYDLDKVSLKKQEAVLFVYSKGIMVGESNGEYSQSRKFNVHKTISKKEAMIALQRLVNYKYRKKLSPDGQLIRTTALPKNYKHFLYILESFANSFYEMRFAYQKKSFILN